MVSLFYSACFSLVVHLDETCIHVHKLAHQWRYSSLSHQEEGFFGYTMHFSRTRTKEKIKSSFEFIINYRHLKQLHLTALKSRLRSLHVDHCFYSVDDFLKSDFVLACWFSGRSATFPCDIDSKSWVFLWSTNVLFILYHCALLCILPLI